MKGIGFAVLAGRGRCSSGPATSAPPAAATPGRGLRCARAVAARHAREQEPFSSWSLRYAGATVGRSVWLGRCGAPGGTTGGAGRNLMTLHGLVVLHGDRVLAPRLRRVIIGGGVRCVARGDGARPSPTGLERPLRSSSARFRRARCPRRVVIAPAVLGVELRYHDTLSTPIPLNSTWVQHGSEGRMTTPEPLDQPPARMTAAERRAPAVVSRHRGGRGREIRPMRATDPETARGHRHRRNHLRRRPLRQHHRIRVPVVREESPRAAHRPMPRRLAPDRGTGQPTPKLPTAEQIAAGRLRRRLAEAYQEAKADSDIDGMDELRAEIQLGRGRVARVRDARPVPALGAGAPGKARAVGRPGGGRMPRTCRGRKVAKRTLGRVYAGKYQPSMFITLTMPSYGRINPDGATDDNGRPCSDGTPLHPDTYDYRRAARDIVHFSGTGRPVDTEPAARGRLGRAVLRHRGTAETRAPHISRRCSAARSPANCSGRSPRRPTTRCGGPTTTRSATPGQHAGVGRPRPHVHRPDHPATADRVGRRTGRRSPTNRTRNRRTWCGSGCRWTQAHQGRARRHRGGGRPHRLPDQVPDQSPSAKSSTPRPTRQHAHHARLHAELERTPCSPRCPVWLRYGVVPRGASAKTEPGRCKGKAHRADTLGLPGRRVLVSRKWSGKTLPDHRADRGEFVRQLLADVGIQKPAPNPGRYLWLKVDPADPNMPRPRRPDHDRRRATDQMAGRIHALPHSPKQQDHQARKKHSATNTQHRKEE